MATLDLERALQARGEHFRALHQNHLRTKAEQTGQPHVKRPKSDVKEGKNGGLQPSLDDRQDPERMDVIFFDHPYPPCTSDFTDLAPVVLSELTMNHHHRGTFLAAKLVSVIDVSRTTATAGIEDANGDVEVLNLSFVCMNKKIGHEWPEMGRCFVIKEPFLTLDEHENKACIRVDHPSDIMDSCNMSPGLLRGEAFSKLLENNTNKRTALQCKEAGNKALLGKDLDAAHCHYTEGLMSIATETDDEEHTLQHDLYRNRAHVRLKSGRYEGALDDAIAAVTHLSDDKHKKLDAKSYFRAANASYKLQRFRETQRFIEAQLELAPGDKDASVLLKRVRARIDEQQRGAYDVDTIKESVSANLRADTANYLLNTSIQTSGPNRGRGLFATRNLERGDLVIAETAYCSVFGRDNTYRVALECDVRYPHSYRVANVGLWKRVMEQLARNPTSGNELLQLHSDYKDAEAHVVECDDRTVIDAYRIRDVIASNAFATSPDELGNSDNCGSSIWIRSSYINHSCIPNTERVLLGDLMMLYATRPIAENEEITISYIKSSENHDRRTEQLLAGWRFRCDCPLCTADAECPMAIRTELGKLTTQLSQTYLNKTPEQISSMNLTANLKNAVDRCATTYNHEVYAGLPHVALVLARVSLVQACEISRDFAKCDKEAVALLHALGHKVDVQGDQISRISSTANSILPRSAFALRNPLLHQAVVAYAAGRTSVADHLYKFARALEHIYRGKDEETIQIYREERGDVQRMQQLKRHRKR